MGYFLAHPWEAEHEVAVDGNGNVMNLVDSTGTNIVASYEYDPFGNCSQRRFESGMISPV